VFRRMVVTRMRIVVLTVVLVVVAFVAESAPARTTSAADGSAASTKFVSKRFGYSAALPGQWFVHYAVVPWLGGFLYGDTTPDTDNISDMGDRKFKVAAKRVPAGTTLQDWTASHVTTMESFSIAGKPLCHKSRAFRDTKLGGAPAREFQNVCLGYVVIVVTAVHGGLGYAVQFVSPTRNSAASDQRTFDAGLRSFRFTKK
jgi:hypothetical protein